MRRSSAPTSARSRFLRESPVELCTVSLSFWSVCERVDCVVGSDYAAHIEEYGTFEMSEHEKIK